VGTPAQFNRLGHRNAATRGITAETPMGWSVPEPAERLAAFSRAMGWEVQSNWGKTRNGDPQLMVQLGRMLYPGDNRNAKGDRWLYNLIWVAVPDEDRPSGHHNKMKLQVNRALTPTTGKWQDGPSLKMISDLVGRHPVPVKKLLSASADTIKVN
jgi:hypothetical protein